MAQNIKQTSKFDFTVESVPQYMTMPDGTYVPTGFIANRRADNFAVLGCVTDRYGVVQNADLISAAEDAFAAKSMSDFNRTVIVTGEGERMYAVYDFKNHVKKLAVGDEVGMRLTVQNSFDGGLRASFALGMRRLVCLNGMTVLEREVSMTRKHSSGVSVKFIAEALEKAILMWNKSTQVFDRLASVTITPIQGANILAQLEEAGALSGKLREAILGIWNAPTYREDHARNLYNLYNAATQHLTHNVAASRFELSTRVSDAVLNALNRAARNPDAFAKLVAPVAVPALSVSVNN